MSIRITTLAVVFGVLRGATEGLKAARNLAAENERLRERLHSKSCHAEGLQYSFDACKTDRNTLTARVKELEGALKYFADENNWVIDETGPEVTAPDGRVIRTNHRLIGPFDGRVIAAKALKSGGEGG